LTVRPPGTSSTGAPVKLIFRQDWALGYEDFVLRLQGLELKQEFLSQQNNYGSFAKWFVITAVISADRHWSPCYPHSWFSSSFARTSGPTVHSRALLGSLQAQ
jgi:hypothetical protein